MNIDVVPDISMRGQDDPHGRGPATPRPPTVGQLATRLYVLAERAADWWPLIRFDPARPTRTRLDRRTEAGGPVELWLTTWPPGHRAGPAADRQYDPSPEHDTEVGTLIAGELIEVTIGPAGVAERPMRAGRVQVRCPAGGTGEGPRQLHNPGSTYAITLHAARG